MAYYNNVVAGEHPGNGEQQSIGEVGSDLQKGIFIRDTALGLIQTIQGELVVII